MSHVFVGRVVTLAMLMLIASSIMAQAAGTGIELTEFTGGAERLFSAMRAPTFVRNIGIAMLAVLLFTGFGGHISGGWGAVLVGLLILGGWYGADTMSDTLFTAGVVF